MKQIWLTLTVALLIDWMFDESWLGIVICIFGTAFVLQREIMSRFDKLEKITLYQFEKLEKQIAYESRRLSRALSRLKQ